MSLDEESETESVSIVHAMSNLIDEDILSQKHLSQTFKDVPEPPVQRDSNILKYDLSPDEPLIADTEEEQDVETDFFADFYDTPKHDHEENKEQTEYAMIDLSNSSEDDDVDHEKKEVLTKTPDPVIDNVRMEYKKEGDLSDNQGLNKVRMYIKEIEFHRNVPDITLVFYFCYFKILVFFSRHIFHDLHGDTAYRSVRVLYERRNDLGQEGTAYDQGTHYMGFLRLKSYYFDQRLDCCLPFKLHELELASRNGQGFQKLDALAMDTRPVCEMQIGIMMHRKCGEHMRKAPWDRSFKKLPILLEPSEITFESVGKELKKFVFYCWLRGLRYSVFARMRMLANQMISHKPSNSLLFVLDNDRQDLLKAWFQETLMKHCETECEKDNKRGVFHSFVYIIKPLIWYVVMNNKSEWFPYASLYHHLYHLWKPDQEDMNSMLRWPQRISTEKKENFLLAAQ